jgi:xanthine dehydrogenase small subunit
LEASIKLASVRGVRELPLEEFFLDYRKTALAPDEVIVSLSMPKLWEGETFHCDKVSKRRDQDISTVAGAYRLGKDMRLAFGGLAGTPKRATNAEQALKEHGFDAAIEALARDFQPLSDWRGTGDYRLAVARNLLRRLQLRIESPDTPVEVEAL